MKSHIVVQFDDPLKNRGDFVEAVLTEVESVLANEPDTRFYADAA